jgi:hypothetical protein
MNLLKRITILALMLMTVACDGDNQGVAFMQPPLKPGQVLDPDSLFAKTWPGKPALVKLNDGLILAIPPQYHAFWAHRHWLTGRDSSFRPPMALEKLPYAKLAGFTMHMPDFSGYTPDNYREDFDESRVEIIEITPAPMISMAPGAPGSYPPNMFQRVSTGPFRAFDPDKYEEKYGLRCYKNPDPESDKQYCYGKRDSDLEEYVLFRITVPPYQVTTRFPLMQTHYFSPKYGGLEIIWRTHTSNFPRWREIDAQIWKYIAAWNIAPKNQPIGSSPAATTR